MKKKNFSPILTALLLSVNLLAQKEDTTCVKSRWISLKPSTENAALFSAKGNHDEKSLLGTISKMICEDENRYRLMIND